MPLKFAMVRWCNLWDPQATQQAPRYFARPFCELCKTARLLHYEHNPTPENEAALFARCIHEQAWDALRCKVERHLQLMDELQKTSHTLLLHDIRCKLGVYYGKIINSFLEHFE